ncbi:SDR family oxidoreductase [Cryptosporangium aurantiacum]|uniref:NADP-dependent 3-hydroxy acid dehydrogenase YdfG n=1 Tax=Cryptosporangium aurantiacum TaxID=134849 RepID=A0A1M7ND22_9ACTN|nr:SDR family NAD(P)-dependent oxidoreductase [Cryptosporangium aurantiacum]SHN01571.1 NADP-dependent 3-hydroxy acid dehydrogenase YdfG [Cryptosporangium aurantiacum]
MAKAAWVTGGASGIGAAVSRRLASQGYQVLVTDVDVAGGEKVAAEVGGVFRRCDVREPSDSVAAVSAAVDTFGGLDLAFLNAGVATGFGLEDGFSPEAYRRVMSINLDGVVYGAHAAIPALKARGGGDIIATASLAGLTAVPFDPIYGANKAAVVGLVRALGPLYAPQGIRVNALCPSFAETAIIENVRDVLVGSGVPLLEVSDVVAAFDAILAGEGTGEAWYVQVGRPAEPFAFRNVPGPRTPAGDKAPAADPSVQITAFREG